MLIDKAALTKTIEPAFAVNNIPVVFAADFKYVPFLGVAIISLVENSSPGRNYDILVLESGFTDKDKRELAACAGGRANISLRFIAIKDYVDMDPEIFKVGNYYSIAAYYRLFTPVILAAYDKIIYLDCDLVVLADVAELLAIDLGDKLLGACRDFTIMRSLFIKSPWFMAYWDEKIKLPDPYNYFNTGVLIMDLRRMRQENFLRTSLETLDSIKTPTYVDQDVLNVAAYGRVHYLDAAWNCYVWRQDLFFGSEQSLPEGYYEEFIKSINEMKILHYYSSPKPWVAPEREYAHHFWRYARQSLYYERLLKGLFPLPKPAATAP